ncbi:MAG: MATE family efflux transporter [Sphaerochaetaceae bacterium]|nr:MATE family efflux transporter [Sphaerochaetaceae bacterium]MDC7237400.1 MATE family efflux transporter [Sphaerochaetaceae bacterium]MDC7249062.1 MATE family efflux transporter [Sphaerochaetaceae bacterium]
MKNNPHEFLGTDKITPLLFKLSIPAMIGMVSNALYNVIDTVFVGHGAGSLAIGGLTIAFPFQLIIGAFALMYGVGVASVISRRLGEGKPEEAVIAASNAFILTFFTSLIILIFGELFLEKILNIFGATEDILPYAIDYMRIILIGAPFLSFSMCANNILRSEGAAKVSMTIMIIGTALNVVFDPIFIFGFGLGIKGAAIATVISQICGSLYALSYFLRGKSSLNFHIRLFKLKFVYIKEIILLGLATFIRQIGTSAMALAVNNMVKIYGGDLAIATFGMVNRFLTLVLMPIFGMNQGLQPIIGYNFGAKKNDRVKEVLKVAIMITTLIGFVFSLIAFIFPRILLTMFTTDQELLAMGSVALRIIISTMVFLGLQSCGTTYFQAIGKSLPSIFLGMSRQFIILIPLVLILPRFFGLVGVWIAFPSADILSSLITSIWLIVDIKKIK